jgi:hypothetical protein
LLALAFKDILDGLVDQLIGVLWKFGVVKLFELVDGELERVDFALKLGHQLLGIS